MKALTLAAGYLRHGQQTRTDEANRADRLQDRQQGRLAAPSYRRRTTKQLPESQLCWDACPSRFDELPGGMAHSVIVYAFDLIEHDGEDLRNGGTAVRHRGGHPALLTPPKVALRLRACLPLANLD